MVGEESSYSTSGIGRLMARRMAAYLFLHGCACMMAAAEAVGGKHPG